jgi:hypothetical protein
VVVYLDGAIKKIQKQLKFLGYFFNKYKSSIINFDKKMGRATIWAIFSETNPVTLAVTLKSA